MAPVEALPFIRSESGGACLGCEIGTGSEAFLIDMSRSFTADACDKDTYCPQSAPPSLFPLTRSCHTW
jgi:hypothetical protein